MSTSMDDTSSSKASCSHRSTVPLFSLHDLSAFKHDPEVEDSLKAFPFTSERSCASTQDSTDEDSMSIIPDLLSVDSSECSDESSWSSSSPGHLLCSISSVKVPDFVDVVPDTSIIPTPPTVLTALHQLDEDLLTLDISAVDYYQELRISSVELSESLPPRGHVDGGALASTTDRKEYLWSYRKFDEAARSRCPRLRVADDTVHIPSGIGYSCIPRLDGCRVFVPTYFTPKIPATIISPHALGKALDCRGYQAFSDFRENRAQLSLIDCAECDSAVQFDLHLICGLLFTDSLIGPTLAQHASASPPVADSANLVPPTFESNTPRETSIQALSLDQTRALWHMRLGHVHE